MKRIHYQTRLQRQTFNDIFDIIRGVWDSSTLLPDCCEVKDCKAWEQRAVLTAADFTHIGLFPIVVSFRFRTPNTSQEKIHARYYWVSISISHTTHTTDKTLIEYCIELICIQIHPSNSHVVIVGNVKGPLSVFGAANSIMTLIKSFC